MDALEECGGKMKTRMKNEDESGDGEQDDAAADGGGDCKEESRRPRPDSPYIEDSDADTA